MIVGYSPNVKIKEQTPYTCICWVVSQCDCWVLSMQGFRMESCTPPICVNRICFLTFYVYIAIYIFYIYTHQIWNIYAYIYIYMYIYCIYIYIKKPAASTCSEVFTFGWWMGQFGSLTPKRHRGFSNNPESAKIDLGVYARAKMAANKKLQTVKRYTKKDGSTGYCGTKHLKATQSGAYPSQTFKCQFHTHSDSFDDRFGILKL